MLPIYNYEEQSECIKEGRSIALLTEVKEVKGEKGVFVHKNGLKWESSDIPNASPESEKKEK